MRTASDHGAVPALARVKRIWAEFDYAQRRLFEIRTGVPARPPDRRAKERELIDELEALYACEPPE